MLTRHLVLASAAALFALAAPMAHAAPAVVINPAGGCGLADGNGNFVFTTDTKAVVTQNNNNNSMFQCKANVPPSASGSAARFDFASTGALCGLLTSTGLQLTDQWHETVSASGEAMLICLVTGKP
ncbi:hypothetical protein [Paraburkholderia elongata]|uniref:Ig-like domain-containing protein n=1 Tax=Paraburkholderia elongata TaxID=2675747 RepID=A0A972ST05_9BURK|nr:hypothetical protein [Paraburkholderia elongata]NPT62445.1 hypothetical protein [Paraburkholderia elongata]